MSDETWDDVAAEWDTSPSVRAYAAAAWASLVALVDDLGVPLSGATVCDFGAGTGLLVERLAPRVASVVAVDTAPAMLEVLAAKVDAQGWSHVATTGDLDEVRGPFDLVVASSVLGFVDDLDATVAALAARLRPGGLLVSWDWERVEPDGDHGLATDDLRRALAAGGLDSVSIAPDFTIEIEGTAVQPLRAVGRAG